MGVSLNLGWNAGARSIGWIDANGEATFKPPIITSDAFVGLSPGVDATSTFEQTHSIRFSKNAGVWTAYVYESSVLKTSLGTFIQNTDLFAIRRVDGVVTYYKNGALVYTSAVASTGRRFLAAALYMGGDRI